MGQRKKQAVISGKIYREMEIVVSGTAAKTAALPQFKLIRISRRTVELESAGKVFTLEMTAPATPTADPMPRSEPGTQDDSPEQ